MERHLITGGNGYLGSHIANKLIDLGHEVIVLDVIDDKERNPKTFFKQVDILDKISLLESLKDVDVVHHNAALVPLRKAGKKFWDVNVTGTQNVLECSLKSNVRHLSHMSSSAVFGNLIKSDCPISKTPSRLKPIEIYGKSKEAGEKIIFKYLRSPQGMSASIIRPRTIIGKERLGIFKILFEWISEGRKIYIIGNGKNIFQFAHVDDLVNASIKSSSINFSGELNIGTDRYGSLRDCLENLISHSKTNSKVVPLPTNLSIFLLWMLDKLRLSPLGPWHYLTYHKDYYFDIENEKEILNWTPKESNDEMLISSYEWYLKNKEFLDVDFDNDKSTHKSSLKQGILEILKRLS